WRAGYGMKRRRPPFPLRRACSSGEFAARLGEHQIDLSGIRTQIGFDEDVVAVACGGGGEQALEQAHEPVHMIAEFLLGAILDCDAVIKLTACHVVEPPCKDVALACLITLPEFGGRALFERAVEVDGERLQGLDQLERGAMEFALGDGVFGGRREGGFMTAPGSGEKVGNSPAAASFG